jgi:O-antigen ligase
MTPSVSKETRRFEETLLCLLAASIPLVLHTGVFDYAILPKRLLLQLGLLLLAARWWMKLKNEDSAFLSSPIILPLLCYFFLGLLSITQATHALAGLVEFSHQATFFCLFVLTNRVFDVSSLPKLSRVLAAVGVVVSVIGILEARGLDASWFPLSNGRPSATFAYRNFAAAYLIVSLPLVALLWIRPKQHSDLPLGIIASTLMLTFLVYTRTRGAWVGLFLALAITLLLAVYAKWRWKTPFPEKPGAWKRASNKWIAGVAIAAMVFLAAQPPHIASRQSRAIDEGKLTLSDALSFASAPQADRGRRILWSNTLQMIWDHPFLGVGLGNWRYAYPRYDKGDMVGSDSAPERPHNDALWIASEMGLPALLTYGWFLVAVARVVIRILKNTRNTDHALYAFAISAALLGMLAHGQVSFPRERIETSFLFWLGLGMLIQMAGGITETPTARGSRGIAATLPVLLLLASGLTYYQIRFDRHYLNAYSFHKGEHPQNALAEATLALSWGAFNPQIFLLQGDAYRATGQNTLAVKAYAQGLAYHPNSAQLYKALGTSYAMQKKWGLAETAYHRAIEIYPNYGQAYNDLGNIYQEQELFGEAIAAYEKAVPLGDLTARRNLALALVGADSLPGAIKIYRDLIALEPSDMGLFFELGEAYLKRGSEDPNANIQARAAFNHFLKNWQGDAHYRDLARDYLRTLQDRIRP